MKAVQITVPLDCQSLEAKREKIRGLVDSGDLDLDERFAAACSLIVQGVSDLLEIGEVERLRIRPSKGATLWD